LTAGSVQTKPRLKSCTASNSTRRKALPAKPPAPLKNAPPVRPVRFFRLYQSLAKGNGELTTFRRAEQFSGAR
jgi:hypothetical protein